MGWGRNERDDVRWLEFCRVTGGMRDDLLAFSADPGNAAVHARLIAHGPDVVEPLLTLVPLVRGSINDAQAYALRVVRAVGPARIAPLVRLLNEAIAYRYDRAFGGGGEIRSSSVILYALRALAEFADEPDCPNLSTIKQQAERYLHSSNTAMAWAAREAWTAADRSFVERHGITPREPSVSSGDVVSAWDRELAEREERRLKELQEQRERDAAMQSLAGAWYLQQKDKK
jgi:hypothetical protein